MLVVSAASLWLCTMILFDFDFGMRATSAMRGFDLRTLPSCILTGNFGPLQVDILSNESELHEVTAFVKDNAQRALGVQSAQVLPVSSRRALEAKLECGSAGHGTWGCIRSCFGTSAGG